ncbi:sigma E protease regulator RseP [Atopomonas sediminilitoris]|uniref:sigma E protease regulator RseP n=1 Tax=Atopomonas sediminilitoris TaxID=2919919 RepID=UPI001F4D9CBD|nr:sigma E protease regulator RseP [Atopomonas sediminilitoris]MCJ8169736.1 sigma E protease regulator RseP [Atopomonas sediminilitoris]
MSSLYMLVGTLIALGVLVTFHEFGHFWVARRCGVKVLRFSVGFGAPLLRWHDKRGTEFVIAVLPLGGYVKMLDSREGDVAEQELAQSFNHKPVGQRMAIVAAGPVANFLLALLFFWIVAMLGSEQMRPVIGAITPDSLAEQAGLHVGDEIVAIDGVKTPSWDAVTLQLVARLGESGALRLRVLPQDSSLEQERVLQLADWQRGVDSPSPLRSLGLQPWVPELPPILDRLEPEAPGVLAGLQAGDRILSLDGIQVDRWEALVELIRQRPGQSVSVEYSRAGQTAEVSVVLAVREEGEQRFGYLGAGVQMPVIAPSMLRQVSFGPLEAIPEAAAQTWRMSVLTLDSLRKMLMGELSAKNLSGPITIAKVAGASAESGVEDFLKFLAYLSISLGVLNLLPVPVLDGGHLVFHLVEWIRGKPLSERMQMIGLQIGMGLVFSVMLLALYNDLARW